MDMEKARRERKYLDICARIVCNISYEISNIAPLDQMRLFRRWNWECEKQISMLCVGRTSSCKKRANKLLSKKRWKRNKMSLSFLGHYTSPEFMSVSPVRTLSYRILQLQGRSWMQGPAVRTRRQRWEWPH